MEKLFKWAKRRHSINHFNGQSQSIGTKMVQGNGYSLQKRKEGYIVLTNSPFPTFSIMLPRRSLPGCVLCLAK